MNDGVFTLARDGENSQVRNLSSLSFLGSFFSCITIFMNNKCLKLIILGGPQTETYNFFSLYSDPDYHHSTLSYDNSNCDPDLNLLELSNFLFLKLFLPWND